MEERTLSKSQESWREQPQNRYFTTL